MKKCLPTILPLMVIMLFATDAFADFHGYSMKDFGSIANNILKDLGGDNGPFAGAIRWFFILTGTVLIYTGIKGLARKDTPKAGALSAIFIGVLVFGVPHLLDLMNMSMFNEQQHHSIMSEVSQNSDDLDLAAKSLVAFSLFMIQIVGFVALYRGLKTLADTGMTFQRQPHQTRAAWIFIIAGVLCINILWTIRTVCYTAMGGASVTDSAVAEKIEKTYKTLFSGLPGYEPLK